jgi:phospholipid/cholesterol/gamma-HCH transport system substrate-binding protein
LKIRQEVQVGVFALLSVAALVIGLNYLAGSQLFGPTFVLYAKYNDVSGLSRGNPIQINGFRVGKVSQMDLNFEERSVMVKMEFDQMVRIPENSEAVIISTDLLGSKGIKIWVPDSLQPSPRHFKSGSFISGRVDAGIFAEAESMIKSSGGEILIQVAQLSVELKEILRQTRKIISDENNQSILQATLVNVQATSENLTAITGKVDSLAQEINVIAANASSIVQNVQGNNENINEIIVNIRQTTDSLVTASNDIKRLMADASSAVGSVETMVSKLDTTSGTLGLLLNDTQLYDSLTNTTERVNSLLREVQSNPQRFFDDIKIYLLERRPPRSPAARP